MSTALGASIVVKLRIAVIIIQDKITHWTYYCYALTGPILMQ